KPGVEPAWAKLANLGDGVIVRHHFAGYEACHEAGRIEQRPQVGFPVLHRECIARREGFGALDPIGGRRAGEVDADLVERGPGRGNGFALVEWYRVVEIVGTIEWREAADGEAAIGPEH